MRNPLRGLRFSLLDFQSARANLGMKIAMLGIALIPLIYGALYLMAFYDPYGKLDTLPVAVVNEDVPVTTEDGKVVSAGQDLVDKLADSDALDWKFLDSAEEAQKGLEKGTYYNTVIIPADFSENVASADTDNPEKAHLELVCNDANNYLSSILGASVMRVVTSETNYAIGENYYVQIFDSIDETGDSLQKAADGAGELADGLVDAHDGSKKITDNLQTAHDGSEKLESGLVDAHDGSAQITDGLDTARDGSHQLADGTVSAADGSLLYDMKTRSILQAAYLDPETVQKLRTFLEREGVEYFLNQTEHNTIIVRHGEMRNEAIRALYEQKRPSVYRNFAPLSEGDNNRVLYFLLVDEEEKLRNGDGDPFHYGVYYSDLLHPHGAAALLMRYGEVLLNTGLVTFGFFSNKLQCQITVDSYKVLTLTGMDLGLVKRVFAMAKVRKERPVTAWDTISPQTPGTTTGVPVDGKTVYDMLVPLKEDFGVSLDRYEVEGGPVYEVEEVRLPEEMDL